MKNFDVSFTKKELEKICKMPNIDISKLSSSDAYSNKFLIKKMFFYQKFFDIYVAIQHGVWLDKNIFVGDLALGHNYALYDKKMPMQYGMKILSIEHPFLFYKRKNRIKQKNNAKGTLIFPMHTSIGFDREYNIRDYIKDLKNLPKNFHPLLICLHYSDVLKGLHHIWYEEGFEVTSAGNAFKDEFVENFYNILCSVKYVSGNESTSAFFYAVDLDIPVFIYGNNKIENIKIEDKFVKNFEKEDEYKIPVYKKYNLNKVFPLTPNTSIDKKTKKFVDDILGKNEKKDNKFYVLFILYKEWAKFQVKKVLYFIEKQFLFRYKKYLLKKSLEIQNHMTLEERLSLIKYSKDKIVVEVGSFLGSNTINIANVAKKVYAIDHWKRHFLENTFEKFKENIKEFNNIEVINNNFEKAYKNIKEKVDVIIIDGEHESYEKVCRDVKMLFPYLKNNGYVIIHHLRWAPYVRICIWDYLKEKTKRVNYLQNLWVGKKLKD